jgi:hypothetical protein
MKVCCTYCSVETRSPSELVPAVLRWGTARVKNAEKFATDREMPLLLLTSRHGLLGKDDLIPPGGVDLSDGEIRVKARLVFRQLQEKGIQELSFLSNPSNRLAIAYLRLITLACDRAGVNLQVLDHSGRPFAEWTKAYRQAEEARRRASKPGVSVEQVFAELFRLYGLGDGMIWFRRGEAHRDRRDYGNALADFRQAGELFTMKEWRDRAIFEAERAEKQIPKVGSLVDCNS